MKAWRRRFSSRHSPNMRSPSTPAAASNAVPPRPVCRPAKPLTPFDFEAVPVISKARIMAPAASNARLKSGTNLLLFGPPGGGSHPAAALAFVVEAGWRELFTSTIDLVQRLQVRGRETRPRSRPDGAASARFPDVAALAPDHRATVKLAHKNRVLTEKAFDQHDLRTLNAGLRKE